MFSFGKFHLKEITTMFSEMSTEMKRELYDEVKFDEAKELFICLEAWKSRYIQFGLNEDIDWGAVGQLAVPDVCIPLVECEEYVRGFFRHYQEKYGISTLYGFISHWYERSCEGHLANIHHENFLDNENLSKKDKVKKDLKRLLAHFNENTVLSRECWKALGWDKRLTYKDHVKCVQKVLAGNVDVSVLEERPLVSKSEDISNNCSNNNGNFKSGNDGKNDTTSSGSSLEYSKCSNKIHQAKIRHEGRVYEQINSNYEINNVKDEFEYIQLGEDFTEQVELLMSDIKLVSNFVNSFEDLTSRDCYWYLGCRFRYLYPARNPLRENVEYIRLVTRVLFEKCTSSDIKRLEGSVDDESGLVRTLQQKQSLVRLQRMFGHYFNRYKVSTGAVARKKENEEDYKRINVIAIALGILYDENLNGKFTKTPLEVIADLMTQNLLAGCAIANGRLVDGEHALITYYDEFKRDILSLPSKYFFLRTRDFRKIQNYVTNQM